MSGPPISMLNSDAFPAENECRAIASEWSEIETENPPAADRSASTSAVTPMNGHKSLRTKAHPRRRQLPMSSE